MMTNFEKAKEAQARYRKKHPKRSTVWALKQPELARQSQVRYRLEHPERIKASHRKWKAKNLGYDRRRLQILKREMVDAYNGICTCCGEWRLEFLSLEHLNRDGKEHRKRSGNSHHIWYELRRAGWPQNGYTVLCLNCNLAEKNGRPCPHKIERAMEALLAA